MSARAVVEMVNIALYDNNLQVTVGYRVPERSPLDSAAFFQRGVLLMLGCSTFNTCLSVIKLMRRLQDMSLICLLFLAGATTVPAVVVQTLKIDETASVRHNILCMLS